MRDGRLKPRLRLTLERHGCRYNLSLNQLYRNGVPFAVDVLNTPITQRSQVNHDLGVFVQDSWTMKRLTMSPGLRWDYFNASIPEQIAPAGRFVPERRFAAVKNIPNWDQELKRLVPVK